jgi:uncharacterized membrane protein YfcA
MLLAVLAALVGAVVQSATGFGFALVLSPALFAVMEPSEAVTALLVLGAALNLLVLRESHHPRWSLLPQLLLAALPGLAAGALLLSVLSKNVLQVGVGMAVIAAAAWQLRHRAAAHQVPAAAGAHHVPAAAAGFISGALTTSISISGPPLVLWLEAHDLSPAEFRATLSALFLALNIAGAAILLATSSGATLDAAPLAGLLALVVAGYGLGALAFRRLDQRHFSTIVLGLVICSGLASIAAGLF